MGGGSYWTGGDDKKTTGDDGGAKNVILGKRNGLLGVGIGQVVFCTEPLEEIVAAVGGTSWHPVFCS